MANALRGVLLGTAAAALSCSPALASGGGASGGGAIVVTTPVLKRVVCVRQCASRGRARSGSTIRAVGAQLSDVTSIVFTGARGKSDDALVKVRPRSDHSIRVRVPAAAVSGPLAAQAGPSVQSAPTKPLAILPPPPPPPATGQLTPVPGPRDPGAPKLETATSSAKAFVGSRQGVTFSYRVSAAGPVSVQVELVRVADGSLVQSWSPPPVQPGTVQTLNWKGLVAGQAQPEGRYAFHLTASSASGARARSAQAQDLQRDSFDLHQHIFPVRGRHDFGQGGARFGAGRNGHVHQGQDVLARCGLRLVAAEGGSVKFKQYQSAAGYYLIIHGDETDYGYMHMRAPSPYSVGDHIATGQQIGNVGDTGDATACHLHFEMWSPPGWYDGGKPFDPLPSLQAWDAFS